jgi:thioredoxin reductase (NADPH)
MAEEQNEFDVIVIGAGPAGLTAGLYAARAGLSVAVFERISPGGQLAQTSEVENYPGFPNGAEGWQLAFDMQQQALNFGVQIVSAEVTAVDFSGKMKTVSTPNGDYAAKSIIIATGAHHREMGLEGEHELQGKGISYCATCDGNFFRGKDVIVVGGGNTAVGDAMYLSRICNKVYLVHRRDKLRATPIYNERLAALDNIEFVWNSAPEQILSQDGVVTGLRVKNNQTGEERDIAVSAVFVAIGNAPSTGFLKGAVELNEAGYVVADESGKTNVAGVFVAGDVRTKALRQVVTAVADGALAAENAAEFVAL